MTKSIRVAVVAAIMAAFAMSAFALSDQNEKFGKGPAQYLMTKDEAAKWKSVKTDADADAFITAFWARRDPTPSTPVNEFKDDFDKRVIYADEHFAQGRRAGSMTDRGHVLIVLGGPAKVAKDQPRMGNNTLGTGVGSASAEDATEANTADQGRTRQIWTYEQAKTPHLPAPIVQVAFVDALNNNDWRLERTRASGDYAVIFEGMNQATLAAMQQATTSTTTTTTTTVKEETKTTTTGPAATVAASLKNAAYQSAIDALKAGTSGINKNVSLSYTELVSPAGEYYVPVALFLPKTSSLTSESADTFFGVVEDAEGKVVYTFEDKDAKLGTSKGEQFIDKTITLPSGKYTAYVGLAKGDTPVVVTSRPLELTEVMKDATGTSKLVLSNNIFETEKAAPVKAPYAFGKLKIVPKANLSFTTSDELTYFVELHNPGIDPATNLPKLQVKLELSGGKLAKPIPRPLSDITALPLTGAPGAGQYAIIDSIDLNGIKSALSPGDYVLKVKIVDTVSKQTYNLEQSFKITG